MSNTFIFDDDDQSDNNMESPLPDQGDDDQAPEEGEGGNRTFMMILIGIGVLALASILCIVGVFLFRPGGVLNRGDVGATSTASVQIALASQQALEATQATPLPSPTSALTSTPTNTPVVVFATETPKPQNTSDPATATVEALQTQLASAQLTVTLQPKGTGTGTGTVTANIPKTGFADGLPGLAILTVILLAIILLARRLREVPAR